MLANEVANILAKKIRKMQELEAPEMVGTTEAAQILGISASRMRQIANRFPHIKQGENKQGRLLFWRSGLLQNY